MTDITLSTGRLICGLEHVNEDTLPPGLTPDEKSELLAAISPAAALHAYAADKRWRVETGGITVAGASIDTSRDSQTMITGAWAYSQAHPDAVISYKATSGFVTLDAAAIAAVASAIGEHVQACFAAEAAVAAAIAAGTITTFAEIDAAAWPAS